MADELTDFVRDSLARGATRAQIEDVLGAAGWPAHQVRRALAAFADVEFVRPVPRSRPYLDARDAFLYLVLFAMLYVSAYHLGALAFHLINTVFPDAAASGRSEYVRASMRWSVASLVVAFPLFLVMSWIVGRDLAADPNRRLSMVRRWLTYLTLFVAAVVLVGDVITLIYNLLGGEITIRFLMKVAVVGLIAGTVFWYYLSDLRRDE